MHGRHLWRGKWPKVWSLICQESFGWARSAGVSRVKPDRSLKWWKGIRPDPLLTEGGGAYPANRWFLGASPFYVTFCCKSAFKANTSINKFKRLIQILFFSDMWTSQAVLFVTCSTLVMTPGFDLWMQSMLGKALRSTRDLAVMKKTMAEPMVPLLIFDCCLTAPPPTHSW